jgi:hypothetical protein
MIQRSPESGYGILADIMLQKMFHAGKYMIRQYYWQRFGTIWGLHIRSIY